MRYTCQAVFWLLHSFIQVYSVYDLFLELIIYSSDVDNVQEQNEWINGWMDGEIDVTLLKC